MTSGPRISLDELRRRLDNADVVEVDSNGVLRSPHDPALGGDAASKKTTLKPSRWFVRETGRASKPGRR
ncbi:MAG: hypothetical protein NTZ05_05135 [Chloroflexi bacterium]|nr:hypothetical protein [Chloroflexota bacterium]